MYWQTGNLCVLACYSVGFVDSSIPSVCRGIYSVDFLYGNLIFTHHLIAPGIFTSNLCNHLEVQDILTCHYRFFWVYTLYKVILDCPCDYNRIVVDIPCTTAHVLPGRESHFGEVNICIGQNTSNQCAALDLRLAVTHRNLNVVVYISLHDFLNEILFQFKPGSVLPFLGNFLPFCFIGVVETHHNTIRVKLNDFQSRTLTDQVH